MRVLFTAAPSTGHVVPLLGVARALRDAGHDVALATHRSQHRLATAEGLRCFGLGLSEEAFVAERIRRWPDTEQQEPAAWAVRMFTQILAPSVLPALREVIRSWRPQLLIHEEGEYAGPAAAAAARIPWITHGWGSPLRPAAELAALEADAAPLWRSAGCPMPPGAGLYQHGLINPCPPSIQPAVPGAEVVWSARASPLRPADSSQVVRVDGYRPLAYVGFGTVARYSDNEEALAAALGAVVRSGCDAIVTTGDARLAQQLEASFPDRVQARHFVDLPSLLPACRLVLCHGGAGTTLAGLAAGIPLVVLPGGTPSQLRMADACAVAGVARRTTMDQIDDDVAALLDDAGATSRARAVAAEIAAMPAAAQLIPPLEMLAVPAT